MITQRPRLLGLAGFSRTGKDTACRLLGGHRIAFADALKEDLAPIIRDRYGFSPSNLTPEQKEILRPLFVAHGACARAVDPDIWIRPVEERIRHVQDMMEQGVLPLAPICVTDLRYLNEARAILRLGGIVLHIMRPDHGPANEEERRSFAQIEERRREGDFAGKMITVVNDGDLALFAKRLKEALGWPE